MLKQINKLSLTGSWLYLSFLWVVRIDYIFYSDDWTAVDAALGQWDGTSDHRPVVAELVLE